MASIFEEMMTANQKLTESVHPAMKKESRKISCKRIKVESRKFFEEGDLDELEKDFEVPEDENSDEVVLVIDPEIKDDEEIPEDAATEMVGDAVYKCPVCGSNYVCDCDADGMTTEGVEVDEFGVPVECPICGDDSDQILVGEIAPADEASGEEQEMDLQSPEEDEEEVEDDELTESVKFNYPTDYARYFYDHGTDADVVDRILKDNGHDQKFIRQVYDAMDEIEDDDDLYEKVRRSKKEDLDISISTDDEGQVDEVTVEEDGETVVDEVVDEEETSDESTDDEDEVFEEGGFKKVCPKCHKDVDYCECNMKSEMKEDFDCDGDDCMVDDEPIISVDTDEVEPIEDDTPDVVIKDSEVNLVLDESKLVAFMNKMLKDNYKGTPTFKPTKVTSKNGTLKVEYVVRNGKKSSKGFIIGEGFNPKSRVMKVAFRDKGVFTESMKRVPIMTMEFVKLNNKIIPTKMAYDYKVKVNESLYRIKGKYGFKKSK